MIEITSASYIDQFRVAITFSDGVTGIYDAVSLLQHSGSLLLPLRDPMVFRKFFLDSGALCWPHGLELSPTRIRGEMQAAGALANGQRVA